MRLGCGSIFVKEGGEMWDERDVPSVLIKKVLIVEVQVFDGSVEGSLSFDIVVLVHLPTE